MSYGFCVSTGDEDPSFSASSEGGSQGQLFIFRFGECDIIKQYVVSPPDSELQQETLGCGTLEEACDLYLRERLHSLCLCAAMSEYMVSKMSQMKHRQCTNHLYLNASVMPYVFLCFHEERFLQMKGAKL